MNKFKGDRIDREFFKNDFYMEDDIEKYKSSMRNTYSYAFYRWNMTILPYKLSTVNWIETRLCKAINFIEELLVKIIK